MAESSPLNAGDAVSRIVAVLRGVPHCGLRVAVAVPLLAAALAGTSEAQTASRLERLEVAIWPEYDQPAALVMYRGWLPADQLLPAVVTLPMPSQVAAPSAVAKRAPNTQLLVAPYTLETEEGWTRVHLRTDMPEVRLEYYVDLATAVAERQYRFEWPGGLEIGNLAYEVMRPSGASRFVVTPSSTPPVQGTDGLIYQREDLGPMPAAGTFFIDVTYTKTVPGLTVDTFPPAPGPPPPPTAETGPPSIPVDEAGGRPSAATDSTWLVVLPILFVAALAAVWILLSSRGRGTH